MYRPNSPRPLALQASKGRASRRSLVSLTPLIDVVFILLIFFMLATSFLDWRVISLNAPRAAQAGSAMEGALLIEVLPSSLRLSGENLSIDALALRVRQRLAKKADQPVMVKASPGVDLQRAVRVLDRLAEVGAVDVTLIRGR